MEKVLKEHHVFPYITLSCLPFTAQLAFPQYLTSEKYLAVTSWDTNIALLRGEANFYFFFLRTSIDVTNGVIATTVTNTSRVDEEDQVSFPCSRVFRPFVSRFYWADAGACRVPFQNFFFFRYKSTNLANNTLPAVSSLITKLLDAENRNVLNTIPMTFSFSGGTKKKGGGGHNKKTLFILLSHLDRWLV